MVIPFSSYLTEHILESLKFDLWLFQPGMALSKRSLPLFQHEIAPFRLFQFDGATAHMVGYDTA